MYETYKFSDSHFVLLLVIHLTQQFGEARGALGKARENSWIIFHGTRHNRSYTLLTFTVKWNFNAGDGGNFQYLVNG